MKYRIAAYCGIVTLGSMLTLPDDYKVEKTNVLNQYFVKLGWFWTNILLLPLFYLTIADTDRESVAQTFARIICNSGAWYLSVNLFQILDGITGYDISGHTFLLIFSNLIIFSELRLLAGKQQLQDERQTKRTGDSVRQQSKLLHLNSLQQLRIVKLSLLALTLVWDFMLIQTALYYHTWFQKTLAAAWAISCWYFIDKALYGD